MNESLKQFLRKIESEFDNIDIERRPELDVFAGYIEKRLSEHSFVNLVFICSHNSRRSQIAQIMSIASAKYYGIGGIKTFSAGIEVSEFNPRAIKALQAKGISIIAKTPQPNPIYEVIIGEDIDKIEAFSKTLNDETLPEKDFVAVMVCSQANESCPVVYGADMKFVLPYEDPKIYDGTELENQKYNERTIEITREMLYIFNKIANNQF